MDGTSATTFEPNGTMTRAMVWAILARVDGETVTGAAWATDVRAWAMAEGVSDGTDPNGLARAVCHDALPLRGRQGL